MELIIVKVLAMVSKALGVGYLMYQLFTKGIHSLGDFFIHGRESELYHTLHEHHWDSVLDFSGGAMVICMSALRYAGLELDLDTTIGTFGYYSLLIITILWLSFRLINAIIDFINKLITTWSNWKEAKLKSAELKQKEFEVKIQKEVMETYNTWEKERKNKIP